MQGFSAFKVMACRCTYPSAYHRCQAAQAGNTSNAVYLRRGILFDSKIKQLHENASRATAARHVNPVPVMAGTAHGWRQEIDARKNERATDEPAAPHEPDRTARSAPALCQSLDCWL